MRILFLLPLLLLVCGCEPPLSEELKVLTPVTITVADSGNPIEGVLVVLECSAEHGAWGANALTDANGVAIIQTSLGGKSRSGVKPGSYKVVLKKDVKLPPELLPEEPSSLSLKERKILEEKTKKFLAENKGFSPIFGDAKTTPFDIDVGAQPCVQTFDIAKYTDR
ncbi:MAG: hypothetical protein Q4G69_11905 [Planctomycetia bacterium]|nr:hypothetical protein [Planctomycetia bacterium]